MKDNEIPVTEGRPRPVKPKAPEPITLEQPKPPPTRIVYLGKAPKLNKGKVHGGTI